MTPEQKLQKRNLIFFPIGTIGRDMMYCLVNNYLLSFIMFTRQPTSAQLAAITAIMFLARVFDAANDPLMGNLIERTRTRWGKFKPWLVIGILSTSVVVYIVFNTSLQGWPFIWLFAAFYFLFSITFTMHDISYWGMVPALPGDADYRNKVTSFGTLGAGFGGTLASVLVPLLTAGSMALAGSAVTAYGRIALIFCILSPAFLAFTVFGVKERRDMNQEASKVSLKLVAKTIFGNKQLLWAAFAFLLQQVGNALILGGVASTYIYLEFGYSGGLYSIFTMVGMSITALLMIFYPAISRKINRKPFMKYMLILAVIGYALMLGAGLLLPFGSMAKYWLIVIGYMISNFGLYSYYLILMISIINTVEYNEYTTGKREEAMIASVRPFVTKFASALSIGITSFTYIVFRVTNYTNRISELEQQAQMELITNEEKAAAIDLVVSEVSRFQTTGLLLVMTVVPCALMALAYHVYKKNYILDEEEYNRIYKELQERNK